MWRLNNLDHAYDQNYKGYTDQVTESRQVAMFFFSK